MKIKNGIGLRFAWAGWLSFFRERNAKIHLLAALLVISLGFCVDLERLDWLWLLLAIALVFITEMLNSAIELLCNALHPGHHPAIGKLKDISAGAVLVAAVFALAVAGIIFVPRFMEWMNG
jgi:diacylglycerol kinase